MRIYEFFLKRPLDFILSFFFLILLSPLLLIISILIKKNMGSPVIFKQKRIGHNNKEFTMYKFKSMLNEKEKNGERIPDRHRLTPFGKKLRASSLDELPELINIIKGDMSLIGPRPLHVRYLPLYNEQQIKRHDVRPGLTGLAQVKGRNSIDWDVRFAMDVKYAKNITLLGDIKILFLTIVSVLNRTGIESNDNDIMPAFTGNEKNETDIKDKDIE